jgi:GSCFA family
MKNFRTELSLQPAPPFITLSDPVFTIGSCFSDSIGRLLQQKKFKASTNPFGVAYNPVSIHRQIVYAIQNCVPLPHTYLENGGLWSNYDFHSIFSASQKSAVEQRIIDGIGAAHSFLKNARYLILTYGTSWVFERQSTNEAVANCHKMPAGEFTKSLLTVEGVCSSFEAMYKSLQSFQPDVKIILTVSPVRHLRDTHELNSVSKAVLRLAAYQLCQRHEGVTYFPAYELMMDDLRDYRFYSSDMLHPSEDAVQYIWEKFSGRFFDHETHNFIQQWDALATSINHLPFHPESRSHQQFLRRTLIKLQELKSRIDVEEEINFVRSGIND